MNKNKYIVNEVIIQEIDPHIKRKNWDLAFKMMNENHDHGLLIPDIFDDEFSSMTI